MKDTIRLRQGIKMQLETLGYNDANEAIAALFEEVKALRHKMSTLQSATGNVTKCNSWQPDEAYWAQFHDEVLSVVHPKPKQEFVPASTIKTIGKIEPGERLMEPVGKQGRVV